ncbi:MAG: putative sulfate transporter [Acidimicrobiales bacterium]|nr:MAG: solute carrier 26 family protein [Actinomycetota bacterium]MBV6510084.1 putative sulfate transporter [Acidimicrobiales bacterium]RIK03578.1 MAG: sodium-independent anion transporter [Acidobacteriota bacterium]
MSRFAPGLVRLRRYDRSWLRGDVLAGVTVAAYLVPQCMAYAEIAGLPPVVGLWAILPPLVIYAALGSSPQLSVGPESTTAIMTASAVAPLAAADGSDYAALCAATALLVGGICVLAFVARLGFLANLLSRPILVGYLAGVALIMIVGQLGKVSGIDISADGFLAEIGEFLSELDTANTATVLLSLGVLALLFAVQHFFPKLPGPLISVLAALVVVVVFDLEGHGVSVVGAIPAGLPRPAIPSVGFDDLQSLLPAAIGIALVGYSDNVLTARGFAGRSGTRVDANQELLALGCANVSSGLFQAFPISSSGSRTTIGDSVGSKSQLYSLVAFACVIAVLFFLSPVLERFPNAALGALVIWAATKLIDVPEFLRLFRFRRTEFLLAVATTVGVLLTDILVGVVIAIVLSVIDLIARIARPHDAVLGRVPGLAGYHDIEDWEGAETEPGLLIYRYDAPLFFANADDFRDSALLELERSGDHPQWFLLQAEAVGRIDSTAGQVLDELITELDDRGIVFAVAELKHDLTGQLERAGLLERIGHDRVFATLDEAVAAFRNRTTTPGSMQ